jgi:K+-sensing histidine kinase KdpD
MTSGSLNSFLLETGRFLLGLVVLAALTALCFWMDFSLVATAFTYLTLIVLFSLAGSFIPSAALSIIAVGCLNYFFVPPIFSFHIEAQDDTPHTSAAS